MAPQPSTDLVPYVDAAPLRLLDDTDAAQYRPGLLGTTVVRRVITDAMASEP